MLLDFSDVLQVNVFVLGSVFLQLGKLMRLEEHPIMTRHAFKLPTSAATMLPRRNPVFA